MKKCLVMFTLFIIVLVLAVITSSAETQFLEDGLDTERIETTTVLIHQK